MLALLVHVPAGVGCWLVFLLVMGETAGALVPGETALILAGQWKCRCHSSSPAAPPARSPATASAT